MKDLNARTKTIRNQIEKKYKRKEKKTISKQGALPPFPPLFGLKNVGFKNEWLPFSDPYYPTWERTDNAFHLLNKVL